MTTKPSDITVGYTIPAFVTTLSSTHLFMYSAVTWNRHHVHYDKEAAISEGLPDIVVHRGLTGNVLVRMIEAWLGENSEIERINWKMEASAVPNEPLEARGEVTECETQKDHIVAVCNVGVSQNGIPICTGNITLRIYTH
ncbi:MaoC/PaaZ C-terminal domain-containing protein [Teredinibacter haidensis]|uniref:MaoC/PaaZ C-terminal domain-containing protein n=1 Tax=Teredinibacter haidensis TaxID=2731755 RepID=UPI0009F94F71|nr:MaoC/PaaZ C-terminal domain-containing protein [Teredinibacter haidensis]